MYRYASLENILNKNRSILLCLVHSQASTRHKQRVSDGKHRNWKIVSCVVERSCLASSAIGGVSTECWFEDIKVS